MACQTGPPHPSTPKRKGERNSRHLPALLLLGSPPSWLARGVGGGPFLPAHLHVHLAHGMEVLLHVPRLPRREAASDGWGAQLMAGRGGQKAMGWPCFLQEWEGGFGLCLHHCCAEKGAASLATSFEAGLLRADVTKGWPQPPTQSRTGRGFTKTSPSQNSALLSETKGS